MESSLKGVHDLLDLVNNFVTWCYIFCMNAVVKLSFRGRVSWTTQQRWSAVAGHQALSLHHCDSTSDATCREKPSSSMPRYITPAKPTSRIPAPVSNRFVSSPNLFIYFSIRRLRGCIHIQLASSTRLLLNSANRNTKIYVKLTLQNLY